MLAYYAVKGLPIEAVEKIMNSTGFEKIFYDVAIDIYYEELVEVLKSLMLGGGR